MTEWTNAIATKYKFWREKKTQKKTHDAFDRRPRQTNHSLIVIFNFKRFVIFHSVSFFGIFPEDARSLFRLSCVRIKDASMLRSGRTVRWCDDVFFSVVLFSRNILVLSYTAHWRSLEYVLHLKRCFICVFQQFLTFNESVFCCCYDYYHHCFQFCMGLFNVYLMWKCKNLFISFSTKTRWRWATTWNPTDVEHFFFLCTDASVFGTEYLAECATLIPITFFFFQDDFHIEVSGFFWEILFKGHAKQLRIWFWPILANHFCVYILSVRCRFAKRVWINAV